MTVFTAETADFRRACQVALELIEDAAAIPLEYFRAIGTPIVSRLLLAMVRLSDQP